MSLAEVIASLMPCGTCSICGVFSCTEVKQVLDRRQTTVETERLQSSPDGQYVCLQYLDFFLCMLNLRCTQSECQDVLTACVCGTLEVFRSDDVDATASSSNNNKMLRLQCHYQ